MNLLCNICGGWSWMVIKPGSLFRKVYTSPLSLNKWLHINSMCYSLIQVYALGGVILKSYFSKHNARKLYTVRQRLENDEVLLSFIAHKLKTFTLIRLTFHSAVRFTYQMLYWKVSGIKLAWQDWLFDFWNSKADDQVCSKQNKTKTIEWVVFLTHAIFTTSHFTLDLPWCTAVLTTTLRHFRLRRGPYLPRRNWVSWATGRSSCRFFFGIYPVSFLSLNGPWYCFPMRIIWLVRMSFSSVGPG